MELVAGKKKLAELKNHIKKQRYLTIVFTDDPGQITPATGTAYRSMACNPHEKKNIGLVEMSAFYPSVFYTSRTFVHEISHQLSFNTIRSHKLPVITRGTPRRLSSR